MKLLVVTQIVDVNDADLGFFHEWLVVLSRRVESLTVVCLKEGEHSLPANVRVLSLGKEKKVSRIRYLWNFYSYLWTYRAQYECVLVHMNPEYVILGGIFWRLWHKKIALWYVHKAVNARLWLAEKMADKIFTASRESFRLPSSKVDVVGHGIAVDDIPLRQGREASRDLRLVSVSRLSAVKGVYSMIETCEHLQKTYPDWRITLDIIGTAITADDAVYESKLHAYVTQHALSSSVRLLGGMVHSDVLKAYQNYDIFLHASQTGSLDKVVLEAMAAGLRVVSGSAALPDCPGIAFRSPSNTTADFAQSIEKIMNDGILQSPSAVGREYVKIHHNLATLIGKIADSLTKLLND